MNRLRSMILLGAILIGAPTPGLSQQQPPQQPPTATERFFLRSECAQLGQKLLDKIKEKISERAPLDFSQKSRYDPTTGHCYVEIDRSPSDITPNNSSYEFDRYLYDGQTGEFLATTYVQGGKMDGDIYVGDSELQRQFGVTSCLHCGLNAQNYIDRVMSTRR